MERFAREKLTELGLMTIQNIRGGRNPFGRIVSGCRRVLELIQDVRSRGIPVILISHNMPHGFEVSDRLHIHRIGRRICIVNPRECAMSDAVAYMTGAI